MAVYNLEEQEQIDELKAWWRRYRSLALLIVVAATLTVGAIQGWRYYQGKQALEAGELYEQLQTAIGAGDLRKVQDLGAAIVERYPRSSYAIYAALAGAKAANGSGDVASAKARLQWVADNAKEDEARELARLRIAAILLDEKKFDDALKELDSKHGEPFSALYANMKGDVLVAQGRNAEARSAYQLALDKSEANSPYRGMIQLKLDALGDPK